ncbi:MAG TPA: ADP-ribosylglycohydrolase family protein, partial [Acidobacteriaceae bacterium]|nr:ADP-ribosylglycohydrolase family protein [Acidobacteriaceae bacterium]
MVVAEILHRRTREVCMTRALESLAGLSCGDAFGECFFDAKNRTPEARAARVLPAGPWRFTDDTAMAISICACLERFGGMEPEWLAESFARHYDAERGYSHAMHALLTRLVAIGAENWFEEAQGLFDGVGSFGNGAAMRVTPVGAYFAHDLNLVVEHATLSAIATHCHPEGIAGAVAVAVAAAVASRDRESPRPMDAKAFLKAVRADTPESAVRDGIDRALALPCSTTTLDAALTIGNGARGSAQDTVPFALWCAARSLASYECALWETING